MVQACKLECGPLENTLFAACLICVEYFYRGLGKLISLNVWIQILLPIYIVDTLAHLQRDIQVTFFVHVLNLKQEFGRTRGKSQNFLQKIERNQLVRFSPVVISSLFLQAKCSKIVTVRRKVPCALPVCKKYYIGWTSFEEPQFPPSILFSEQSVCLIF